MNPDCRPSRREFLHGFVTPATVGAIVPSVLFSALNGIVYGGSQGDEYASSLESSRTLHDDHELEKDEVFAYVIETARRIAREQHIRPYLEPGIHTFELSLTLLSHISHKFSFEASRDGTSMWVGVGLKKELEAFGGEVVLDGQGRWRVREQWWDTAFAYLARERIHPDLTGFSAAVFSESYPPQLTRLPELLLPYNRQEIHWTGKQTNFSRSLDIYFDPGDRFVNRVIRNTVTLSRSPQYQVVRTAMLGLGQHSDGRGVHPVWPFTDWDGVRSFDLDAIERDKEILFSAWWEALSHEPLEG